MTRSTVIGLVIVSAGPAVLAANLPAIAPWGLIHRRLAAVWPSMPNGARAMSLARTAGARVVEEPSRGVPGPAGGRCR